MVTIFVTVDLKTNILYMHRYFHSLLPYQISHGGNNITTTDQKLMCPIQIEFLTFSFFEGGMRGLPEWHILKKSWKEVVITILATSYIK
jgi:hypothetical protein